MARAADEVRHGNDRMERKHILMPPSLIRHDESLANEADIAFAEIVRRALWRYGPTSHR